MVQVTFTSTLSWVEKGLDQILADIGQPLRYRKEKKGLSTLYAVLVEFSLDYFVPSTTLIVFEHLSDDQHHFNFDYVGLAFLCFRCLLIHHASASCPSKSLAKPVAVSTAPTLATIVVAKDLLLNFAVTPRSHNQYWVPHEIHWDLLLLPTGTKKQTWY